MTSKVFFLCLAVAAVNAGILPVNFGYAPAVKVVAPVYHAPSYAPKVVEKPRPYDFNYEIQTDDAGSLWQRENGDEYGNKQGSFGYRDANGVYRQVEYVADEAGFRPVIKTNEPGTANANPADVQITAEESPVKYEAPVKAYTQPKVVKIRAPVYHQPAVYAAHVPVYHKPAARAVVRTAPYG
ncbi:cuticle protein 10.9-like [Tachypleus tridentatus]|uniref:cuticle protein 10.9-like n=1 Tax=Tachypleus tridentatus TaxID=6853 RepID=UPI003FD6595B